MDIAMTVEQIEGVKFVDRDFWTDAMAVVAQRPFPRSTPDHNERAHDYKINIAETAFAEGYPTVHLNLLD